MWQSMWNGTQPQTTTGWYQSQSKPSQNPVSLYPGISTNLATGVSTVFPPTSNQMVTATTPSAYATTTPSAYATTPVTSQTSTSWQQSAVYPSYASYQPISSQQNYLSLPSASTNSSSTTSPSLPIYFVVRKDKETKEYLSTTDQWAGLRSANKYMTEDEAQKAAVRYYEGIASWEQLAKNNISIEKIDVMWWRAEYEKSREILGV